MPPPQPSQPNRHTLYHLLHSPTMPEPTPTSGKSSIAPKAAGSTPLDLLKAVKEVQERRVSVWREYDDAFDTFLYPPSSASTVPPPINGPQNNADHNPSETESAGRGCSACSSTTIPLSEDLLAQILQITTQALIECGHRLRTIQTELSHSSSPNLANLVDCIQSQENALLRSVVQRDQLRKTLIKPMEGESVRDDADEAKAKIAELQATVKSIRDEIGELMQDVYAESLELQ